LPAVLRVVVLRAMVSNSFTVGGLSPLR